MPNKPKSKNNAQQRALRTQSIVFLVISVIIILAMVLSMVSK